jgi:excisionase family DNA binding protein
MLFKQHAIDVAGAAAFLHCSKTSVYAGVRKGALPVHRVGKLLRFFEEELHEATTTRDRWARSSASAAALNRRRR